MKYVAGTCNIARVEKMVKVQVYSLISSISSDFTFYPLVIRVPYQLHGEHIALQLFWRIELIVHIVISVLPGTRFQSREAFEGKVLCPWIQH